MWGVRGALKNYLRGAVDERPVGNVGVPGHPANVSGAPVNVCLWFEVKDGGVGESHLGQVPAGGVQNSLGVTGSAGRVQNE